MYFFIIRCDRFQVYSLKKSKHVEKTKDLRS